MLSGKDVSFSYNEREVLRGVSFSVNEGQTVGLVGPNGIGKSTLLKAVSGDLKLDSGQVIKPQEYEVGYMPQDLEEWASAKIIDFLGEVSGVNEVQKQYEQAAEKVQDKDPKTLVTLQEAYDRAEKHEVFQFEENAEKALDRVGLGSVSTNRYVRELSGGQRTRLALAAVMLSKYDLFLLDEPTNNLDIGGIALLEQFIKDSRSSFMVVSHDRRFLRQTADRILELTTEGDIESYGLGYDEYIAQKHRQENAARQRYEESREEEKRLQTATKKALKKSELANSAKNRTDNEKMSFDASKEKAAKSHSKAGKRIERRLEHMDELPIPPEEVFLDFDFEKAKLLNKTALSAQDIIVKHSSNQTAPEFQFGPFSLDINIGERTAITGSNGVGKTTFLNAIINPSIIESGTIDWAKFANIGYMDQHHSLPDRNKTAIDNFKALTGAGESESRRIFKQFNINDEATFTSSYNVSPGERSKVLLAAISYNRSNVLLLDEPTNHLDIPSIEGLERSLKNYPGAILIITHDRDFMDALNIDKHVEIQSQPD